MLPEAAAPTSHGDGGHHPALAHHFDNLAQQKEAATLGMWVFLGSECLLFGGLITTFLFYREKTPLKGPTIGSLYDIPYTSVSSFVLLMSSLTMVLAVSAIKRGDQRNTRVWLTTTALLGASFVAGQVYEFTTFYREGLSLSTNLFGSSFFVMTGFHGVNVTLGILMLLTLYAINLRGGIGPEKAEVVELVGLYWHFVDIVWIVIFTVIYLIP